MNITKTGQFITDTFTEMFVETDGSTWELVFVHNKPGENKFDAADSFTDGFSKSADLYFNFNICNSLTSWEFLVIQVNQAGNTPQKRRWIQNKNPLTAAFSDVAANAITKNTGSEYTQDSWGGFS